MFVLAGLVISAIKQPTDIETWVTNGFVAGILAIALYPPMAHHLEVFPFVTAGKIVPETSKTSGWMILENIQLLLFHAIPDTQVGRILSIISILVFSTTLWKEMRGESVEQRDQPESTM